MKSISEKWSEIGKVAEPIEFNEKLCMQKEKIMELFKMKNEIIEKYYDEIQHLNKSYVAIFGKQVNIIKSFGVNSAKN